MSDAPKPATDQPSASEEARDGAAHGAEPQIDVKEVMRMRAEARKVMAARRDVVSASRKG